jgi:hypothetical protein
VALMVPGRDLAVIAIGNDIIGDGGAVTED